jgi:hypothetical protein
VTPETLFSICGLVATCGWLLLIFAPAKRWSSTIVAGRAIPLLFAVVYLFLFIAHWGEGPGGFGSLHDVAALFANPWILLAGWIHYLAFDLFIGSWEVRDSIETGVSHWFVIPCLALTFLFGPVGLLSYFGVRTAVARFGTGKL